MYIHEYQSKRLLHTYEIPVPRSEVFTQGDSIEKFVANFGGESWIVKAQVHAGGRGKAGGILWTCLLYTSPSPRDVEESRMPSSA